MASVLDDLAGIIGDAFADVFYAATLHHVTGRVSDGRGGGTTSRADYPARALVDDYSAWVRSTLGIPDAERKIIVLGASVAVIPAPGDVVTVQGGSWLIVDTKRDPAAAAYECRSKPVPAPGPPTPTVSLTGLALKFNVTKNSSYIGQVI